MSSEAIDYVKKPTMEFINDSWRLVKRCTKPDRTGAQMRALASAALLCCYSKLPRARFASLTLPPLGCHLVEAGTPA